MTVKEDSLTQLHILSVNSDPEEMSSLNQVTPEPVNLDASGNIDPSFGIPMPSSDPRKSRLLQILRGIQKYSAYSFTFFTFLHTSSVVFSPVVSIELSTDFFWLGRSIYQIPLVENTLVYGSLVAHVLSGIGIRLYKRFTNDKVRNKNKKAHHIEPTVLKVDASTKDDIGLGGLTSLLGLGYRRSFVSRTLGLSPAAFSGYVLCFVLSFHIFANRIVPQLVDGDSSLISIQYITHALNQSGLDKYLSWIGLTGLVCLSSYHIISGYLKFWNVFSLRARQISYGMISGFTLIAGLSLYRISKIGLDTGFIGKQFDGYLEYAHRFI